MYTYIHIHMYIYIYIHTYNIYTHLYIYVYIYIYIYIHTCIHTYIYICIYTYTYIHITYIYIRTHTHTHTHTHIYIYIFVMSHRWTSHVTRLHAWCHTYESRHMTYLMRWRIRRGEDEVREWWRYIDKHLWRIHTYDMNHSYVRHNSFVRVTLLIDMCDLTHDPFTWVLVRNMVKCWHLCVVWLTHTWDMTR